MATVTVMAEIMATAAVTATVTAKFMANVKATLMAEVRATAAINEFKCPKILCLGGLAQLCVCVCVCVCIYMYIYVCVCVSPNCGPNLAIFRAILARVPRDAGKGHGSPTSVPGWSNCADRSSSGEGSQS
jgi:hypothetical protein